MALTLTPDLEQRIATRLESGRFRTAEEVVAEALSLLEARETRRSEALSRLRERIAVGLEEVRRGDVIDGDEFFDQLEREHEERVRADSEV